MKYLAASQKIMLGMVATMLAGGAEVTLADDVAERLDKRRAEVRAEFDDVVHLQPDDVLALQTVPVLIDVRKPEEFAVSHLPHAMHAPNTEALLEIAAAAGDRQIVVYCSLGVRSSKAARLLAAEGYDNVANLDGSLFRWANEGRPLVNEFGPTDKAHPFNFWWGRYLNSDLHQMAPPDAR